MNITKETALQEGELMGRRQRVQDESNASGIARKNADNYASWVTPNIGDSNIPEKENMRKEVALAYEYAFMRGYRGC